MRLRQNPPGLDSSLKSPSRASLDVPTCTVLQVISAERSPTPTFQAYKGLLDGPDVVHRLHNERHSELIGKVWEVLCLQVTVTQLLALKAECIIAHYCWLNIRAVTNGVAGAHLDNFE